MSLIALGVGALHRNCRHRVHSISTTVSCLAGRCSSIQCHLTRQPGWPRRGASLGWPCSVSRPVPRRHCRRHHSWSLIADCSVDCMNTVSTNQPSRSGQPAPTVPCLAVPLPHRLRRQYARKMTSHPVAKHVLNKTRHGSNWYATARSSNSLKMKQTY